MTIVLHGIAARKSYLLLVLLLLALGCGRDTAAPDGDTTVQVADSLNAAAIQRLERAGSDSAQVARALADFEAAAAANPADPTYPANAFMAYVRLGREAEAAAALEQVAARDSNAANVHLLRGHLDAVRGAPDGARRWYASAVPVFDRLVATRDSTERLQAMAGRAHARWLLGDSLGALVTLDSLAGTGSTDAAVAACYPRHLTPTAYARLVVAAQRGLPGPSAPGLSACLAAVPSGADAPSGVES